LRLPGRIARHGRQQALRIPRSWPWRDTLMLASRRLVAITAA
jgi:hypothetical protein